jgi:hypothetical protein
MKKTLERYQNTIITTTSLILLVVCYFQQKELSKLRKEIYTIKKEMVIESTTDSLLNKVNF